MPKKRKSKRSAAEEKTLVRAANGDLYVVTKNKIVKLENRTRSRVRRILNNAEAELAGVIDEDVPTLNSGVNLGLTEVFGHH